MDIETAEICRNCTHAWKRDHHDFEYYGNRGHAFECCIASENSEASIYRRLDDTCDQFKRRNTYV